MMHIAYHPMTFPVYIYLRITTLGIKDGCGHKPRGNLKSIEFFTIQYLTSLCVLHFLKTILFPHNHIPANSDIQ